MTSDWRPFERDKDGGSADLFAQPWGHFRPSPLQRFLIAITQKTVLQRGAFRPRMSALIMSLARPLDIRFRDCCYRIEGRNNLIERGLLIRPSYNAQEIEFLQDAVRDGGVAVDIGSNIGLYALPLARAAGDDGRVLAIDANPEMTAHLAFHAQASELTNLIMLNMAVGGEEARVDLLIRQGDVAIVSVEQSETGALQMRPLLNILADAGLTRVDALKIDIEGHEDAAMVPFLQQATEDLLPARIVIERESAAGDYPGCVAEFDRLGYRLVGRTRNNSMYERG